MWFICLRRSIVPREQWTVTVDEHLAWIRTQHESGAILFSGPGRLNDTSYGIYSSMPLPKPTQSRSPPATPSPRRPLRLRPHRVGGAPDHGSGRVYSCWHPSAKQGYMTPRLAAT